MDELRESESTSPKRRSLILVVAAVLLLVGGIFGGRALRDRLRTPPPAPAVAETPAPIPAPPRAVDPVPEKPAPVDTPRPRPPKPREAAPPPAEPPAPTTATLRFEADVEGAIAFIDRQFVGNMPVTVENVAPGTRQINVSAPGYDSYGETIEVTPGPREIVIRFREVRLSETVEVVHKHGIGSCEGRLVADLDGIRYVTSNKGHAFSAPLAEIESLEVNYLEKNLRLKLRGGRTYNFTDKTSNADKLYVFQRNVEKARTRLANGDPPAKR